MQLRKKVLIVDDSQINRKILNKILSDNYDVLIAGNGREALRVLAANKREIACIMLDLVMPVMSGFDFLEYIVEKNEYLNIPVIITTENSEKSNEKKALQMGAWDFVSKPYDADIIKFRLKNAIARSQLSAFQQLKYMAEYDILTGIYNKNKFFAETKLRILRNPDLSFAFVRLDIDRFALVNSFYGREVGDKLLLHIAACIKELADAKRIMTYGRIEADIFTFCCAYECDDDIHFLIKDLKKKIKKYDISFDIVPVYGIYKVEDNNISVDTMFDNANLAVKRVKGGYIKTYEFFNESMRKEVEIEQSIVNEMNTALLRGQFHVYLQPKYSLQTNQPAGAEALVRWIHPTKGMISPGAFIPVFERNGFIEKLDYYMWEQVCKIIRSWLDRGITPQPISVNVSRVNLYNPKMVDNLCELTEKYNISNKLISLELLESLYIENPKIMQETIDRLHEKDFAVMMDDFGSGYSSLNILKDMDVDYIKLDMGFFSESKIKGRGESIITSVVRMVKWLNIPTIAEGVEHLEQVEFLRSIGCEYVQGYYFARPMPVEECEKLIRRNDTFQYKTRNLLKVEELWSMVPQVERIFDNVMQAVAIYEVDDDRVECIRANNAFSELFSERAMEVFSNDALTAVYEEFRNNVHHSFMEVVETRDKSDCEYLRYCGNNNDRWIHLRLKYICLVGRRHVVIGSFQDITAQKRIDFELHKYKAAMQMTVDENNKLLVVDDVEINRAILSDMFADEYEIFQAVNGEDALDVLERHQGEIDLILLDLMMPVMDGLQFLEYKRNRIEYSDIPVIIITADDSPEQQVKTLSMGANDYITKPFVKEMVLKRVNNVLESQRRFRKAFREVRDVNLQSDDVMGIYSRLSAEHIINKILLENSNLKHSMILFSIDRLEMVNQLFGTKCGEYLVSCLIRVLKLAFRTTDIIAKLDEDEFCVFMMDAPNMEYIVNKCNEVMRSFRKQSKKNPERVKIPVVSGVALSEPDDDFSVLHERAKTALKNTKRR